MIVRVVCTVCPSALRVPSDEAKRKLQALGRFAYGHHVQDERAFALRLVRLMGWGVMIRLGTSTVSLRCPAHGEVERG
jgi:hypothetical protein